jgi:catechol 2,3-dioxygenase-like lactoylglutathione lyase family enzyme
VQSLNHPAADDGFGLGEASHWVLATERIPAERRTTMSPAPSADGLLQASRVATRLPAQDLERARTFYADKLGLEPVEERPGGLRYECASGWFALFESSGAPSGVHTQIAFEVDDIDETVRQLRDRGVIFEEYDTPGLRTSDGIANVDGNYPSTHAVGERAAWFHDSEGNLLAIGQWIRRAQDAASAGRHAGQ